MFEYLSTGHIPNYDNNENKSNIPVTVSRNFLNTTIIMLSQSKRMSVFDMVREAMDFRYPLSSPPPTRFSTRPDHIQASFTSPLQDRAVLESRSAQVLHKTPNRLYRNTQTWLDHNILLPTSSSPIQTPSERSIVSADSDHVEAPGIQASRATGNSPNFHNTLQLSDGNLDLNPSPNEFISPKDQSIDPASIEQASDEEYEEFNISGLTELTESSLGPADCNIFNQASTRPSTTLLSGDHWLAQPTRLKRDKHPGDLFLGNSSARSLSRDYTYELDMMILASQRQHSPTESELASRNFGFHKDIPEEEQVQRFQNNAFRRALRTVASGLSLKKQYYAWDRVRVMLNGETLPQKSTTHEGTATFNAQKSTRADLIPRSARSTSIWIEEAIASDQDVLHRDFDNYLRYHQRLGDDMEVDQPQSAAMEISPIEDSGTVIKQNMSVYLPSSNFIVRSEFFSSGALVQDNDKFQHALLLDDSHPFGQQRHFVPHPQHDGLQKDSLCRKSHSTETEVKEFDISYTNKANTPQLLPNKTFEIREDSSASKATLPISPSQSRTSSIVSVSSDDSFDRQLGRPNTMRMTRVVDSSAIRQSIERETPRGQFIRESTPAYEDRSASPSPVSRASIRIASDAYSDNDVDMLDVPNLPFEREDSMPPPSTYNPTRSSHGIQREYNLPSSSPTTIHSPTRIAYREVVQQSPNSLLAQLQPSPQSHPPPQQHHSLTQTERFLIPAPPPIPTDNHPFKLSKRSTRRKSIIHGGKPAKIEKPRSTTIGTVEQQQDQRGRTRSRKVTQSQARARINRVITQVGSGSLHSFECGSIEESLNAGRNDGSSVGMRRSKRLMEKA